jgi:hypothetical protein
MPNSYTGRSMTSADRLAIAAGSLSLLAGVALLVIDAGFVVSLVGAGLVGLAAIAFVALAFLLAGESEDRDREGGRVEPNGR